MNFYELMEKSNPGLTSEELGKRYFDVTGVRVTPKAALIAAPTVKVSAFQDEYGNGPAKDMFDEDERLPVEVDARVKALSDNEIISQPEPDISKITASPVLRRKFNFIARPGLKKQPPIKPKADIPDLDLVRHRILGMLVISNDVRAHRIIGALIVATGASLMAAASVVVLEKSFESATELPSKPSYCTKNSPMIVEGRLNSFKLTDSDTCKRVLQAVPKPTENFTVYNKNISIRAKDNGSFEFRLLRFGVNNETLDDWLKEPVKSSVFSDGKLRRAYLDIYKFKTGIDFATGKDDFIFADRYIKAEKLKVAGKPYTEESLALGSSERVRRALAFREKYDITYMAHSPVSAENYRAVVEGWLISGGTGQNPLPFSFFLSKWFLESQLGNNITGRIAFGLNQFTAATWLTSIKRDGTHLRLDDDRAKVLEIWKKHKLNDRQTLRDPEFRALFRAAYQDASKSASMGAVNTTVKLNNILSAFQRGDIALPDGRKHLTEVDGYIGHMLAGDYRLVYQAMAKNPDMKMIDVLRNRPAVYNGNVNLFENRRIVNKDGKNVIARELLTARGFYEKISHDFGFSDTRTLHPQNITGANLIAPGSIKYEINDGIGVKFRLVANPETAGTVTTLQARPNVNWIVDRIRGIGVESITTAGQSAAQPG